MRDIDPDEDAFVENLLEISIDIAEKNLVKQGAPLEWIQRVKKDRLELRVMYDEILQIDAKKRTRSDIEKAWRNYLERMSDTAQSTEDEDRENIENLCKMFIPDYVSQ